MKRVRFILLLMLTVILLSNTLVYAEPVKMDYKEFLDKMKESYYRETGKTFDTPTPIFTVKMNGETYIVRPFFKPYKQGEKPELDDVLYENDSRLIPSYITVPVGTSITFEDASIGGDGRGIAVREWQIYFRHEDYNEYDRIITVDKTKKHTVTADREGYILAFLNVYDTFEYKGFHNWSEKGNWRTTYVPPEYINDEFQITGWYYTVENIK